MSIRLSVRPGVDLGFRTSTDGQDQVLKLRSLDGRTVRVGRAGSVCPSVCLAGQGRGQGRVRLSVYLSVLQGRAGGKAGRAGAK